MTVLESLKIALRALRANILRSFLTMLGIIVGVASVVSMVAFATGAQREIAQQIRTLGANVLMVIPEWDSGNNANSGRYEAAILTETDAAAIGSIVQKIAVVAPSIRVDMQVVNKNRNTWVTVNGTTSNYFAVREWPLRSGRIFSVAEQSGAEKVALLGQDTTTNLFGEEDPIGKTIRIHSVPFKVIGILSVKGTSGSGRPQDDIVFIPISTSQRRLFGSANMIHRGSVDYILAKATSTDFVQSAQQEITSLLRQRHRISFGDENDFRVVDPAAMMEAQNATKKTIGWLLTGIASVSLIVGGISIMNIMLVSVTERTREIGLRIAIGAQPRDVQLQFLMEAVLLCFLGGVIGLGIGAGAAYAVGILAGWPIYLSPVSVIGAVGLASTVGLLFGFFPARRASRLDPVAALKFE
jgi:putative ABC transport system permease protein